MLRLALAALLLVTTANLAAARTLGQTEIVNEAALAKLKNNAGVTLQWLWGAAPGKLVVTETPQGVTIAGGQGPHEGDQLEINGIVTRIDRNIFWFKGRITIIDNETKEPCIREGLYTFRIFSPRRFWRLKENAANCPGRADLADYVDVRF